MVATIGEPFLLSSYDSHRQNSPTALYQNVYATHGRSSGSKAKEGCATVTVHGDGVHVFDVRFFPIPQSPRVPTSSNFAQVSDLHISGSYTLGPSTIFAGPSVSRVVEENGTRSRRIYAIIEKSPGLINEDHGRTVWMWDDKQTPESSGVAQEKKSTITVRCWFLPFFFFLRNP
jgi:hypothetical protein